VALEAVGDGLAQRPEREQPELHQRQHHRVRPPVDRAASSAGARDGGEDAAGAGAWWSLLLVWPYFSWRGRRDRERTLSG
jgi:hypothetical protein